MTSKLIKSNKSPFLKEVIELDGDKSCAIRALVFAALFSQDNIKIHNLPKSDDVQSVAKAISKLKNIAENVENDKLIDLGNSRTGLVFILAYVLVKNIEVTITGDESLSMRNLEDILEIAAEFGCAIKSNNNYLPIHIVSGIRKSPENIVCNGSAQHKSFATILSLFSKKEVDVIENEKGRDHTENMLQYMGISRGEYMSEISDIFLPGDPSSAAFLMIYAILSKQKTCFKNLCLNIFRTGYLEFISNAIFIDNITIQSGELVGDVHVEPREISAFDSSGIDSNKLIDEYPIIAVLACFSEGRSRIILPERLVNKESNRIKEITKMLDAFSVSYNMIGKVLNIQGYSFESNKQIKIVNKDHRIIMCYTIMGLLTNSLIEIEHPEMVKSSFPEFFGFLNL